MPDSPDRRTRKRSTSVNTTIGAEDAVPSPFFYIVSPNRSQARLLRSCLENALSLTGRCHSNLPLQAVVNSNKQYHCVYLLDCLEADAFFIRSSLDTRPALTPDHIMIALYNITSDEQLAVLVKHYRIRGIFYRDDSQAVFIKGVMTILCGHLWLTRKMLSKCVRSSGELAYASSSHALAILSRREKEILQHVVRGESNQEIADAMRISLHTVKTHLYNTYRKINVPNRLQAAIWATAFLPVNP